MGAYPYKDRFPVNRALPERGRSREEILGELRALAREEDAFWETGKCSGTMYCGDKSHYAFLTEAFGLFAHQNALQRDMCCVRYACARRTRVRVERRRIQQRRRQPAAWSDRLSAA